MSGGKKTAKDDVVDADETLTKSPLLAGAPFSPFLWLLPKILGTKVLCLEKKTQEVQIVL